MTKTTQRILATDLASIYPKVCDTWQKEISMYLIKYAGQKYIEIENSTISKAYNSANDVQKKLIIKYFSLPKEFDYQKITSYSQVCKHIKEKQLTLKDFNFLPASDRTKALAFAKIKQLERCFNGDWKPNWKSTNESKYFSYLVFGFDRFCFNRSSCYDSYFVGGAGFYKSREISDYVGKTFSDIYNELV